MADPASRALLRFPRSPWSRALWIAVGCATVGSLALTFLGARGIAASHPHLPRWPFLEMWIRWDAGWYQGIATDGYTFSTREQSSVAYFPLYPLLLRAGVALGVDAYLSGMITTLTCGALAAVTFSRWARLVVPPGAAPQAIWFLLLWPFAYYLLLWPFAYYLYGAVYSDALFLLLVTSAFWQLEERRIWWATGLGALATATRPVFLAVILGLTARAWELRAKSGERWGWRDGIPLLSSAGLVAYMVYLHARFGDALAFLHAQAGWAQTPGPRTWFKIWLWESVAVWSDWVLPLFHAGLAVLLLGMAVVVRRRMGWGYALYTVVALGIPLASSRDFIGLGRYGLCAFPSFLALACALENKPRARAAWLAFSTLGLGLMVARFAIGRYVS
jgi:hypothetical protein